LLQPEYKLDKKGRCLYKVHEFISIGDKTSEIKYVTDLFTNQTVADFNNWNNILSEEAKLEYEKIEDDLFK